MTNSESPFILAEIEAVHASLVALKALYLDRIQPAGLLDCAIEDINALRRAEQARWLSIANERGLMERVEAHVRMGLASLDIPRDLRKETPR